jgi:hypothetical protein
MTQTDLLILVGIAVLAVAAIGLLAYREWTTRRLKSRFGTEYNRAVDNNESQAQAEAELREREKRARQLEIHPVSPTDRAKFVESWRAIQTRFVDEPGRAVTLADRLLDEVMTVRGYPVGDYEQRSADVSVDHPETVQHYHEAHAVAVREQNGRADTEDLRRAMISYRAIFDELVGDPGSEQPRASHAEPRFPAVH